MEAEPEFWNKETKLDGIVETEHDLKSETEIKPDFSVQADNTVVPISEADQAVTTDDQAVMATDETNLVTDGTLDVGDSTVELVDKSGHQDVENNIQPEATTQTSDEIDGIMAFNKLMQDTIDMEVRLLKADQEELENFRIDSQFWNKRLVDFIGYLETSVVACKSLWEAGSQEINKVLEDLSDADYKALINGRISGLDLVVSRMMDRLLERTKSMLDESSSDLTLVTMSASEWSDFVSNLPEQKLIGKEIAQLHKKLSNDRYKVIANERNQADKNHKKFVSFIEKQVLPVIDGIVDGAKNSRSLEKVMHQDAGNLKCYIMLMQIYRNLYDSFIRSLNDAGVNEIVVERGEPIDYEKHEPFDMEPDAELPNERVKESIRNGFEYVYKPGLPKKVLRATQVVVVKN